MSESESMIFRCPARISKRVPTAELLTLAREARFVDEEVFEELKPFFFQAEISNNLLDSYFTRMSSKTLSNFADDAKAGVSLQDSHNARRLGVGRSVSGKYEKSGEVERVVAEFYTVRGLNFNDATYQTSDDFINAIRAGIASDVSVGFYGGMWICSVCKVDMWDWESGCRHWPGDEVEIKDENGNTLRKEIVFAWIADARLSEVSLVYNGATPGAVILKAERAIHEGILRPEKVRVLEHRYRIKLPDARQVYAPGNTTERSIDMSDEKPTGAQLIEAQAEARTAALADVRAALTEAGLKPEGDLLTFVRSLKPEAPATPDPDADLAKHLRASLDQAEAKEPERLKGFRDLATKEGAEKLVSLASDGQTYRSDLIGEAIAEGVRAHGAEFAQETYRQMLQKSDIATIKRMRDDWKAVADKNLAGGRQTEDSNDPPQSEPQKRQVPDAAFLA
ncbi:MAG: hypothetical protein AB1631_17430 [Acidobacteriota bacterium]